MYNQFSDFENADELRGWLMRCWRKASEQWFPDEETYYESFPYEDEEAYSKSETGAWIEEQAARWEAWNLARRNL